MLRCYDDVDDDDDALLLWLLTIFLLLPPATHVTCRMSQYKAFAEYFRSNTAITLLGPAMNCLAVKVRVVS